MKYHWDYRKFEDFTYNVLPQEEIKSFLLEWIKREWEIDHREYPDQPWTLKWLDLLPRMEFKLVELDINIIKLNAELMSYNTEADNFVSSLQERAQEREESLLRGVSTEPLLVNLHGWELMDGYTRYVVFKKHKQKRVLAYVGTTRH